MPPPTVNAFYKWYKARQIPNAVAQPLKDTPGTVRKEQFYLQLNSFWTTGFSQLQLVYKQYTNHKNAMVAEKVQATKARLLLKSLEKPGESLPSKELFLCPVCSPSPAPPVTNKQHMTGQLFQHGSAGVRPHG